MKNKLQNTFCVIFFVVTLSATAQQAALMINEVNPNISNSHDLIELVAVTGGSMDVIVHHRDISSTSSTIIVSAGDIIVVHLNGHTATGAAPFSEWSSKNQYPNALYSANYDNAWDVFGSDAGLSYSNCVLQVTDVAGNIMDAVPFTNYGGAPGTFSGDVATIQGLYHWYPSNCGGAPCNYFSFPTVESISVNWQGVGTTPTGNTVQRISFIDTDSSADWTTSPQPPTWGALNPGQIVSVNEEKNSFTGIYVFPNPATNELTIKNAGLRIERIEIYDVLGQKCLTPTLSKGEGVSIDITSLQNGVYFIKLFAKEAIFTAKFVKE